MRQDGGLDEHAALQPALSPWKLPNEVSFIILLKNDNKLCLLGKSTYFDLFYHFIMGKQTHPRPPYSQPDRKNTVFFDDFL